MSRAVTRKQPVPPAGPSPSAEPSWGAYLIDALQHKRWPLAALAAMSGLLLSLIFSPGNIWPLAYVCLVPWLIGAVTTQRRMTMFLSSYVLGALFFFFSLNWMWPVTIWPPEGLWGIKIPIGTLLLAMYLGLFLPLSAWLIRFAYKRLGVPLALAVPVVWVATEFVRGYLPIVPYDGHWQYTGLQWFFLAHSHYNALALIQSADLAGAYGVSFLIAMVNGWLVELVVHPTVCEQPGHWTPRQQRITAVVVSALAGNLIYGLVQLHRDTLQPGPRIAVVQTDELMLVNTGGFTIRPSDLSRMMWNLLEKAVHGDPKPDIVVLPETMWPYQLNREFREMAVSENEPTRASRAVEIQRMLARRDDQRLKNLADESGTTIIVGALATESYPERPHFKTERFNSVLVYRPGQSDPQRYDKIHLVLFGEFIPFRRGHLHWLYNSLNEVMPWTEEYSLTAGTDYRVFDAQAPSQAGRTYRFGTPICYEITMSDACRQFGYGAIGKRADLLINLSNDGWFLYNSELPQHLAIAVFRAVENRLGLVRSVNTGISAAIDPKGHILAAMLNDQGQWREPVDLPVVRSPQEEDLPPYRGFSGVLRQQVPVDPTITLYMRWGNWLPVGCMFASACLLLAWWIDRSWIAVRHIRRHGHGRDSAA
jgi:apolipoprotein N-acyltransferase